MDETHAVTSRSFLTVLCACQLVLGAGLLVAEAAEPARAAAEAAAPAESSLLPPEQLDSLVAPIALYPDPLLAQTLAASTYPLEIVQLQQWLEKNERLKDKALMEAVAKQPWDPAIQSMAAFPDVVKRLGDEIQWTTDLGNAFLAQQADVMVAVQRMRKKAADNGTLTTTEQQTVETEVIENQEVIVVEPTDPDVVYVPYYDPVVVYGPPYYPYPPIYYPYYPPGVSFGWGVVIWGGMWGDCDWDDDDIDVDVDNEFNRDRVEHHRDRGEDGRDWRHNPEHRGGAPYGDRATAEKFGGTVRGERAKATDRTAGSAREGQSPGAFDRSGSGDRIGDRNLGGESSRGRSSAFGEGSASGYSGSRSRASSARGASSAGSWGGGRGGGRRGGGRGGRRR